MYRLILIFLVISNNSIAAIFGMSDDRVAATSDFLYSSGTIFCDGGVRGSATHLSHPKIPDSLQYSIVLSAAHVLYEKDTYQPFKECVFRPQNKRLNSIGFYSLSNHKFKPILEDKIKMSIDDLVFIALKRRLPGDGLKLDLASSNYKNLKLVGYNEDEDNISVSSACQTFSSITFSSDRLLLHNCDAKSGASGGSIIDGLTKKIIGVHGGTFYVGGKKNHSIMAKEYLTADPERLVNEGRKIDQGVIVDLISFILSLSKDS
jgi:hypothetical protein